MMGRPTFKGYVEGVEGKTGKTLEEFWRLAVEKGFVKQGKVVAKHGEILKWLKSEAGLGHVHANFMILYISLRANDPKVSDSAREWASATGYKKPDEGKRTKGDR
jgi:hypothetical protein